MPFRSILPSLLLVLFTPPLYADLNSANADRARGDYVAAAAEYQRLAESGDPVAQVNLGYMYYVGEGVTQDYGQALAWYNEAASQGNADAQYNLAVAYAFGEGVDQDFATAVEWYRAAAEQGHAVAQYSLGLSYAYGEGVDRDPVEAATWFTQSAEQGYVRAQTLLGSKYHTGDGVALDYEAAVKWYRLAAEQGDAMAQFNLAGMYRSGNGVAKDNNEALNWYRKAVDQGYSAASAELASLERSIAAQSAEAVPVESSTPVTSVAVPEEIPAVVELPDPEPTPVEESAMAEVSSAIVAPEEIPITAAVPATESLIETPAVEAGAAEMPEDAFDSQASEEMPSATALPVEDTMTEAPAELTVQDSVDVTPAARLPQTTAATTAQLVENQLANLNRATDGNVQSERAVSSAPDNPVIAQTSANSPELLSMEGIDPDLPENPTSAASELLSDTPTPGDESVPVASPPDGLTTSGPGDEAPADLHAAESGEQPLTATGPGTAQTDPSTEPAQQTSSDNQSQGGFFSRLFGSRGPAETDATTANATVTEMPVSTPAEPMTGEVAASSVATNTMSDTPVILYENGLNELKNKNFGTAVNNFRSAAARGYPLAQYQLASHYHQGLGIRQDNEEAALWYRRAAEQGIVEAQYNLGNMYLLGEGIVQDDTQARYWYELAAAQGHSGAIHNLQNLARLNPVPIEDTGPVSVNQPIEPTPVFAMTSVQSDEPAGMVTTPISLDTDSAPAVNDTYIAQVDYERGLAYSFGEGVAKDLQQAFALFKRAAENNYAPAQYKLGIAYAYGEGTNSDLAQAFYWYEKAAMQGHPIAQRNLGISYQNGEGTGINKPLALAWFGILADRGNVMDIRRRETLASELGPEEISQAEQLKLELLDKLQATSR